MLGNPPTSSLAEEVVSRTTAPPNPPRLATTCAAALDGNGLGNRPQKPRDHPGLLSIVKVTRGTAGAERARAEAAAAPAQGTPHVRLAACPSPKFQSQAVPLMGRPGGLGRGEML